MDKRTDAQIFILGHKEVPYGLWDNSLYTPLQVGAAYNPHFLPITDDIGDNIGIWNPVFAESTGLYWISKNADENLRYLGNCQYRRRIGVSENIDFDDLFNKCQIICSAPMTFDVTVLQQYQRCHSMTELDMIKGTVMDLYPQYEGSWKKYIEEGHSLLYSSGFIMRREDYINYADFFTKVCFETLNRMGLHTPDDVAQYTVNEINAGRKPNVNGLGADKDILKYQMQLAGFWQERLSTLYIFHHFDRILFTPFIKMENI